MLTLQDGSFDNTTGSIEIQAGGGLQLNGATLTGGKIQVDSAGSGSIFFNGANTMNIGSLTALPALFSVQSGSTTWTGKFAVGAATVLVGSTGDLIIPSTAGSTFSSSATVQSDGTFTLNNLGTFTTVTGAGTWSSTVPARLRRSLTALRLIPPAPC